MNVNFWDMSGHPEFFQVRNDFYTDTQAVRHKERVTERDRERHGEKGTERGKAERERQIDRNGDRGRSTISFYLP